MNVSCSCLAEMPGERFHTVAILPPSISKASTQIPTSTLDVFDICINPLSVVLKTLASACDVEDAKHVYLYVDDDDEREENDDSSGGEEGRDPPPPSSGVCYSDLAQGLLRQYGIQTTRWSLDETTVDSLNAAKDGGGDDTSSIVVIATRSLADGKAIAAKLIDAGTVVIALQ